MSSSGHKDDQPVGGGPKLIIPKSAVREKGPISIRLHTKQIQQPPNTIPVADLIDKCCQKIFNTLENSLDLLTKMANIEKKRLLLTNLSWMKEVLMKVYLLAQDTPNSRKLLTAMDLCQEIFGFRSKLFNIPDSLYGIHMENLRLPQPAYDVSGALQLVTNSSLPFPSIVKPKNEWDSLVAQFENFMTKKIAIKAIALDIFKGFGFELTVSNGFLTISLRNAFVSEFSFDLLKKKWILVKLNYSFLHALNEENFAFFLNSKIQMIRDCEMLDEFMQVYVSLYCIIYFGTLIKLKLFADGLKLSLDVDELNSFCVKVVIWPEFEDYYVRYLLPCMPEGFDPHRVVTEIYDGISNFPTVIMQDSFHEQSLVFIDNDLGLLNRGYRTKATMLRLSQIQYFLPEYFTVTLHQLFAQIDCHSITFLLFLDDSSGNFILTRNIKGSLECYEFKNINEFSEGIVSIFLKQTTERVLNEICYHYRSACLTKEVENCIVEQYCNTEFLVQIQKHGISIYQQNNLLLVFDNFTFDFTKYKNALNSHVEKIFQETLQTQVAVLNFRNLVFSNFSLQNNVLIGNLIMANEFFSPSVSVKDDKFYIPLASSEQLRVTVQLLNTIEQFMTYLLKSLPNVPCECRVFVLKFSLNDDLIEIDFLGQTLVINNQPELLFGNILWSAIEAKNYEAFFSHLASISLFKQQLSSDDYTRFHCSFGNFLICLFDNLVFKITIVSPDHMLISNYSSDSPYLSLCSSEFVGSDIPLTSLGDFVVSSTNLDRLISKFNWLVQELEEIIGKDKVKRNFNSLEFAFNSFNCMLYLTGSKIVFNQVFLTDPSGKAFSTWIENEIEKSTNMKALVISLLHLLRTSPAFMTDFCKIVLNFESNSSISCYIPLVLPPSYCANSSGTTQHTITFNSTTKILTFFLIFKVTKTAKCLPLFLSYNLIANTIEIPDKYKSALDNYNGVVEHVCKLYDHKSIQISNYLNAMKQQLNKQ